MSWIKQKPDINQNLEQSIHHNVSFYFLYHFSSTKRKIKKAPWNVKQSNDRERERERERERGVVEIVLCDERGSEGHDWLGRDQRSETPPLASERSHGHFLLWLVVNNPRRKGCSCRSELFVSKRELQSTGQVGITQWKIIIFIYFSPSLLMPWAWERGQLSGGITFSFLFKRCRF